MDFLHSAQKHLPAGDDRLVGGAQVFFGPVGDAPLQFLDGAILGVDADDAAEIFLALHLAIDQPIIFTITKRPESFLIDVVRTVGQAALGAVVFGQRFVAPTVHPVPYHAALVVDGHPHMAGIKLFADFSFALRAVGANLRERHDEVIAAHILLAIWESSNRDVTVAECCRLDIEARRTAAGIERIRRGAGIVGVVTKRFVQDADVGLIQAAFEGLQPITFFDHLRDMAMAFRHLGPTKTRRGGHLVRRAHIRPNDAAKLASRIGLDANLGREAGVGRFVELVHALARDIVFPAMPDATQAVLFVAAQPERSAAVSAEFIQQTDAAGAIAEHDQRFAQKFYSHRRAIGFGYFPGQQRRYPIAPHGLAHRRARSGARQQIVLGRG